jgi:hypothetical protein
MKPIHFRRAIGVGLIALALLGVTSLVMKEYRLALFGERATGVVTKVEKITTGTGFDGTNRNGRRVGARHGGESTFMYLDLTSREGKTLNVKTLATFNTEAKVGDSHPMIYLPTKPENAKIYSAKQLWLPMCVGTVFSAACFFGGLRLLKPKPVR